MLEKLVQKLRGGKTHAKQALDRFIAAPNMQYYSNLAGIYSGASLLLMYTLLNSSPKLPNNNPAYHTKPGINISAMLPIEYPVKEYPVKTATAQSLHYDTKPNPDTATIDISTLHSDSVAQTQTTTQPAYSTEQMEQLIKDISDTFSGTYWPGPAQVNYSQPVDLETLTDTAAVNQNNSTPENIAESAKEKQPEDKLYQKVVARLGKYIKKAADEFKLSEELLARIIIKESTVKPFAISDDGAFGYMQLMPETAREYGLNVPEPKKLIIYDAKKRKNICKYVIDRDRDERCHPKKCIRAGVAYLSDLMEMFNGDLKLALSAYNRGDTYVRKIYSDGNGGYRKYEERKWKLPKETRDFVETIIQKCELDNFDNGYASD